MTTVWWSENIYKDEREIKQGDCMGIWDTWTMERNAWKEILPRDWLRLLYNRNSLNINGTLLKAILEEVPKELGLVVPSSAEENFFTILEEAKRDCCQILGD